jgi:soluble lytic murein transglycosylase-like protein
MQARYFIICGIGICFFSYAEKSNARNLDILRSSYERLQYRSEKSQEALRTLDVESISQREEKAVALFSRGLAIFEETPAEAEKSFAAAQKVLPSDSPLFGLVSIYQGRAALNKTNARVILGKLNFLTKGNIKKSPMWRPEKFALMIEIVMLLEQDHLLVRTWTDMSAKVKPAMRDARLTPQVIAYLERRDLKSRPELWPLIESLAAEYPHGNGGRWAFQKLQELSCLPQKPYVHSLALISRLSSNVNLDEGLKHFLIELTQGPVRFASGKVGRMEEFERLNYLFQNRFWNEARRLLEDRLEASQTRQDLFGKIDHAKSLNLLGQIQTRQGDYEGSIKTWSLYIELFSDVVDTRAAMENLADGLSKLRYHRSAAQIYGQLAKRPGGDPVVRWHHFWNLYLAGELNEALALLDKGNYVPHRDRGIEGGLDYWRARILEKQNKTAEADEIFKRILTTNGDNFYSALILARKPALMDSVRRGVDPKIPLATGPSSGNKPSANLAVESPLSEINAETGTMSFDGISTATGGAQIKKDLPLAPDQQSQLRTASALGKWGRKRIARRLLRLIPTATRKGGEGYWVESFRLAIDLKDYSYGFKAPQMIDSPLRKIPSSVADLEVHMLQYNSDWRLLYPYAFREIVDPAAAAAGIDPFLLLSLMRAESIYDEDAQSQVGAQGLMQIMPFTAVRLARVMQDTNFELSQLRQPEINISYASYYLKMLADYYKGNMILAVAAYNGGPTSVDRWLSNYADLEMDELVDTMSFRETRRYVKSVFRNLNYYKFIWQQTRALAALPSVPANTTGEEIF